MRLSPLYRSVPGWLTAIIVAAVLALGAYAWASGFSARSLHRVALGLMAVLALVGLALLAHGARLRALGLNLSRLRLLVFGLGVALAAIAGVVMAPIWGIRPHVGVDAVVPAFLIIVLGGVGSLWGAVIAGLMVGMVVGLTGAYASEWSLMSMYLLFIAVVTFRSRGLFGKKSVLDV